MPILFVDDSNLFLKGTNLEDIKQTNRIWQKLQNG